MHRRRRREPGLLNPWMLAAPLTLLFFARPVGAFQFQTDDPDFAASFDNTVAIGAAWRTQGRDPALIGIANGGTARSVNDDDGDLNWPKGSLFALPVYYTGEIEMKYRNLDFFTRFDYLYDQRIEDNDKLGPTAKALDGSDVRLLDFFAGGRWDPTGDGRMLSARMGRQVLNWGESTFIPNGINAINPIDLRRLRSPGSELRNALLPLNTFWASQDMTKGLTLEGYYQFEWGPTRIDPVGTYFSSNDFASPDGEFVFAGFGRRRDFNQPIVSPRNPATAAIAQVFAPIQGQVNAKNSGQFGFAARVFVPSWNNTELGFYGLNYHSRIPVVNGVRGTTSTALGVGTARYFPEFPENINLYGVSFSTPGPWGVALQGEYSYRPNQPLALAGPEILLATLGLANSITGPAASCGASADRHGHPGLSARRAAASPDDRDQGLRAVPRRGPVLAGGRGRLYLPGPAEWCLLQRTRCLPARSRFRHDDVVRLGPDDRLRDPLLVGISPARPARVSERHRRHDRDAPRRVCPGCERSQSHLQSRGHGAYARGRLQLPAELAGGHRLHGLLRRAHDRRHRPGARRTAFPPGQSRSYASSTNPLQDRDFLAVSVSYSF